jgi:hypothetical protein
MSIINKYFEKLNTLTNNYELDFMDDFDFYIFKYNVEKNNKLNNSKVYFLLKLNLKKELEKAYISYIKSYNNNNDEGNIYNTTVEMIKKEAQAYIEFKYNKLLTTDDKFKLIRQIEKKYKIENKDTLNIRYI